MGTADQSIYDFQGATPDYLIGIKPTPRCFLHSSEKQLSKLTGNSGCLRIHSEQRPGDILLLESFETTMPNWNSSECSAGMDEQYNKVIEQICKFHAEGTPYHEIAVLVANNKTNSRISAGMLQAKYSCIYCPSDF